MAEGAAGPVVRWRRPADRRSRPERWRDPVAELVALQGEYQAWLDALPERLQCTPATEALETIRALDLSELEGAEPPKEFGRD